jgi:O-antigen ligase
VTGNAIDQRPEGLDEGRGALLLFAVGFMLATSWTSGAAGVLGAGMLSVLFLVVWARGLRTLPVANRQLATLAMLVAAYWALLVIHPNVPDLWTGLLGWRKSCLMVVALGVGLVWPTARGSVRINLIRLLTVACAVSLAVHVLAPGLEQSITRAAVVSTSQLMGEVRMQGLFAGPFHVSMAAAFLVVTSVFQIRTGTNRPTWILAILVGIGCLVEARVRTGYLVVAMGLLIALSMRVGGRRGGRFVASVALWLLVAAIALELLGYSPISRLAGVGEVLESILNAGNDQRFTYRFETWRQAWVLIQERSLLGWGAGSAGDTLGQVFVNGRHVTPHNVVIKYLVEGGLIGATLVIVLVIGVGVTAALRGRDPFAIASFVVLLGFGTTGSAVEAIPVTVVIGVVAGLSVNPRLGLAGSVGSHGGSTRAMMQRRPLRPGPS